MAKKIVSDLDLKGKTVLVRADFNVPLKDGEITNDNRIVQALPTIQYIIEQGGKIVLFSHLGKVKEESDKAKLTLRPVAEDLSKKLDEFLKLQKENKEKKEDKKSQDKKWDELLKADDKNILNQFDLNKMKKQ
ncbi:MAG: phosphoglycerate kinase, partial [Staphylococcus epidermidis]|nr:phosphoglycerate kinase [Staphylococcus epidermidis]